MQKELYLRILDQFPNPIWRAALDTKCDYFNKAWLSFTGRTIEQESGDGWVKGVHPEDLNSCVKTYLEAFKAREPFEMEYRLMHSDGTYHWLLDSGSPFFNDNGEFMGYIGSCYDINETKQYILEIEKMNNFMVDRELKIIEMKKEIEELKKNIK
ncbi:MAG: PAS domain-containing protein [Candidatus Falkowbacteria bacterium]